MSKIKAALLMDIGNSETRCVIVHDNKSTMKILSNGFAKLTTGYVIPEDYLNDKTTILKIGKDLYANGELALREFEFKIQRPVVIKTKSEQESTVRSFSLGFIEAYRELATKLNVPVEELEIEFDVVTALPPTEHKLYSEKLKELIRGIKEVEIVTPVAFKKTITVNDIFVISEGAAAFTAVMYDEVEDGIIESPANEMFFDGDVLVIDIGAGTSDMILFRDGDIIINAKDTFKKGGDAIKSKIRQSIKEAYGYSPSDAVMERVISEGLLIKGTDMYDVSEFLNNAKEEFSAELYNRLVEYIQAHNIEPRELKGLLVIGGGSLPAIRDGRVVSVSLSEVVIKFIREITSSIALVDTKSINPRLLNIEGLRMFYLYR